jgi:predicted PP-loop superfamily ATPase
VDVHIGPVRYDAGMRYACPILTRSHLRELGLERRAVDAVFKACQPIYLPGYRRPLI